MCICTYIYYVALDCYVDYKGFSASSSQESSVSSNQPSTVVKREVARIESKISNTPLQKTVPERKKTLNDSLALKYEKERELSDLIRKQNAARATQKAAGATPNAPGATQNAAGANPAGATQNAAAM